MLHKKSIIFALFHKYTVYFARVVVLAGQQAAFFVGGLCDECFWLLKIAHFLMCGSGGGVLCVSCISVLLSFFAAVGLAGSVERVIRSLFCLKRRFCCERSFFMCGCSRIFLQVIAVVGNYIAAMRDMKVGIYERKRGFFCYIAAFVGCDCLFCVFCLLDKRIDRACTATI